MNYNVKGTGLGLSITKSIVEHYGVGPVQSAIFFSFLKCSMIPW